MARLPALQGYRIARLVGEGRVAAVYLADDLTRGGQVALKLLKDARGCDESVLQGFAAECGILSSIRHQHVVRVFEHRALGDPAFLAMEYLGGGTLRDRMRGGVAPLQALSLLHEAASGLAAAHRLAIVHRDIKPENFLLRASGALVLADFGVAARRGDTAARVARGQLAGTPGYAAPEQARGESPGEAADVYSLGIVFYELLCGRRPFTGKTALELLSQHLVAPVPPLAPSHARFQRLVDRMLEKKPQRRLPDADAVLQEIQRIAPEVPAMSA